MMAEPNYDNMSATSLRHRRAHAPTSDMRGEVEFLFRDLKQSCRCPLLDQVVAGYHDNSERNTNLMDELRVVERSRSVDSVETGSRNSSETTGRALKRRRREDQAPFMDRIRRWDELLSDASMLLPFMAAEEHGVVSRLASILLLGYLIPSSTGNEFFINHACFPKRRSKVQQQAGQYESSSSNPNDLSSDTNSWYWRMSLEERLENSSRYYNSQEYGEIDVCSGGILEESFTAFITKGLAPFLAGRPAHREETDLVHLLAMAISPQPSVDACTEKPSSQRAKGVMQSLHAHYFQIQYKDRLRLVHLVVQHLVLPEQEDTALSAGLDSALMDGAVPHLRASLHAFSLGAMSPYDAHWAHSGLVNIAIQTGQCVVEEWDTLLRRTLQDVSDYECSCVEIHVVEQSRRGNTAVPALGTTFCPHVNRGELMERFISRYNGSRHYADGDFTRHVLSSLSTAIQGQLDSLTNQSNSKDDSQRKAASPPCQLAALLSAARNLFFFFLTPSRGDNNTGEEEPVDEGGDEQFADADESEEADDTGDSKLDTGLEEEQKNRNELVKCAINLLRHPSVLVVSKASSLLAIAFSYGSQQYAEEYASDTLTSVELVLHECFNTKDNDSDVDVQLLTALAHGIENVVVAAARQSIEFSSSLISFLVVQRQDKWKSPEKDKDDIIADSVYHLVSAVALAQPKAASRLLALRSLASKEKGMAARSHLVATLLSCRYAHFFSKECEVPKYQLIAKDILSVLSEPWVRYKLARHAMVTANFAIAQDLCQDLLRLPSTEKSYLWLSALSKVAAAENSLSQNGARGIPSSTPALHSALTYLHSLSALDGEMPRHLFDFQIEVITLRLDLLDLCVTMRGLASEIRLTGVVPKSNTRSGLHMHNMDKCFYALASRYFRFYRRFGIFRCQQSRTAIRTLFALCRFLGRAAGKVFSEVSTATNTRRNEEHTTTLWPKGDSLHPMICLIEKLDDLVVKPMGSSVDPIIRAAALLELLEGVLMAPLPFPRGFTTMKQLPFARLRLSPEPSQVKSTIPDNSLSDVAHAFDDEGENSPSEADVVHVNPGMPYTVFLSGTVPQPYLKLSELPVSHVVAWYTVSYDAPLNEEDERLVEERAADEAKHSAKSPSKEKQHEDDVPPASSRFLPHGQFFLPLECLPIWEEGFYRLEVTLGCRDIRCGEWEIPVAEGFQTIFVRVALSSD